MCEVKKTDAKVRAEVQEIAEKVIYEEEEWRMILEIVFKDIYANYICMGKDVPYKYFINIAAAALRLVNAN